MSTVAAGTLEAAAAPAATAPARVALLGTGTVGTAVLARLGEWAGAPFGERLSLVYAANSRAALLDDAGLCPRAAQLLAHSSASFPGVSGYVLKPPARTSGDAPESPSPPGRGVGVRVRRSDAGELRFSANVSRSGSISTASPNPHPPPDQVRGRLFGHPSAGSGRALLPGGEGKNVCPDLDNIAGVLGGGHSPRILIDATASDAVADRHATWLAQGIHVVTACKLGAGTDLRRWRAIRTGCAAGGSTYGDAATVGAGLPLLRSIRELQAGGDRIRSIAGVLSGSLAWLFDHYDGRRPFSGFVREARDAGYTEPDPREDLSGEDVRRKLLILARAAGVDLESDAVQVESLVPAELAIVRRDAVDETLPVLDAPLRDRFAVAWKRGEKLRFIARLDCDSEAGQARIGLESLAADHPLAGGAGTDNKLAIWSDRYRTQPLVIQGPGAGAEVTAAGLLDDALRIAASPHVIVNEQSRRMG